MCPSEDSDQPGHAEYDQSLLCALLIAKVPRFLLVDNEDSDQTTRKPRLVWVFAGRKHHSVGVMALWLV